MTILPKLAETPGIDWSKPIIEWSREVMVEFLLVATQLICEAMAARDLSERGITRKSNAATIARQANAAAGGPLMTPNELKTTCKAKRHGPESNCLLRYTCEHRDQRPDRGDRGPAAGQHPAIPWRLLDRKRMPAQDLIRLDGRFVFPLRTLDIFRRGHLFEAISKAHLVKAGFCFAPDSALGFSAAGGLLRGHADGIITAGPNILGAYLPFPCVWEHKCLGAKGWRSIERDGLEKAYPQYHAQVLLYQAYLDITNPALFTITNADTCERLHLAVLFNAERAQAWSDRATSIIEATRAGELLPRFTTNQEDWRCRFCGHRERCWR